MKTARIAIAIAAIAAMLALPAAASAGMYVLDKADGTPAGNLPFTISSKAGENFLLTGTNHNPVACTSLTGSGTTNLPATGGGFTFKLQGCTQSGLACHSGTTSGVVESTANLPYSNVVIDAGPPKVSGITIKGNGETEHWLTMKCGFTLVTIVIEGTVLGEVENCGSSSPTLQLNFQSSSSGHQRWKQVTTTGTIEDLQETISSETDTLSLDGTWFMHFTQNVRATC